MFEQVAYKPLVDSLTNGCTTDSAKALNVYNFVANNCNQPTENQNPKYDNTYDVLTHKTASCDQQVWLLMQLLQLKNIKTQMVFLYGYDSISHHTVAAVELTPGRYGMLDPFNKLYFIDGSGKLASIGDIMKGNVRAVGTIPPDYFKLYETRYDLKYHSDNTLDRPRKMMRSLLRFNQCVFGVLFTKPFEALN